MLFNFNIYNEISGNLNHFCGEMTHAFAKLLIMKGLTVATNSEKCLRLPLVDSIGLSPVFMIKMKVVEKVFDEVAKIGYLSPVNVLVYKPSCWQELRV